jgi:hypothetical protein
VFCLYRVYKRFLFEGDYEIIFVVAFILLANFSVKRGLCVVGLLAGGSNKILRYNQPGTKHSVQVAYADIQWNN